MNEIEFKNPLVGSTILLQPHVGRFHASDQEKI